MTQSQVLLFLNDYGLIFIFIVVFMEYLNLPGFPSGIIMPVIGFWSVTTQTSFLLSLTVSVIAGIFGSVILYYVGKFGGKPLLEKIYKKYPKTGIKLKNIEEKMMKNANTTVFISKLLPVVRTLVGFIAGASGIRLSQYLVYSSFGIIIWNSVLMVSGSALGTMFLN